MRGEVTLMLTKHRETEQMRRSNFTIFSSLNDVEDLRVLAQKEIAETFSGNERVISVDQLSCEEIVRKLNELGLAEQIGSILTTTEEFVLIAAQVREGLGIPGQSWESAVAYRNKFNMKKLLRLSTTFKVPKFWHPSMEKSLQDVFSIEEKIVKKPIDGAGGVGITIYDSFEKIDGVEESELVEQWIDLPVLHVDGLIHDGQIVFSAVSKYLNSCLSFKEKQYVGSQFSEDSELNLRATKALQEVIQLLPSPMNFAFHLELFYSDTELFFCEIACRQGGGWIPKMIEKKFGVNLAKENLRVQAGLPHGGLCLDVKNNYSFIIVPYGTELSLSEEKLRSQQGLIDFRINQDKEESATCVEGQFFALLKGKCSRELNKHIDSLLESVEYQKDH